MSVATDASRFLDSIMLILVARFRCIRLDVQRCCWSCRIHLTAHQGQVRPESSHPNAAALAAAESQSAADDTYKAASKAKARTLVLTYILLSSFLTSVLRIAPCLCFASHVWPLHAAALSCGRLKSSKSLQENVDRIRLNADTCFTSHILLCAGALTDKCVSSEP